MSAFDQPVANGGPSAKTVTEAQDRSDSAERAHQLLRATMAGTAACTGPDFFDQAVKALAAGLDTETAFISLPIAGRPGWNGLLAHWVGSGPGELLEYEIAGTPCEIASARGVLSGAVMVVVRDITERKALELRKPCSPWDDSPLALPMTSTMCCTSLAATPAR